MILGSDTITRDELTTILEMMPITLADRTEVKAGYPGALADDIFATAEKKRRRLA